MNKFLKCSLIGASTLHVKLHPTPTQVILVPSSSRTGPFTLSRTLNDILLLLLLLIVTVVQSSPFFLRIHIRKVTGPINSGSRTPVNSVPVKSGGGSCYVTKTSKCLAEERLIISGRRVAISRVSSPLIVPEARVASVKSRINGPDNAADVSFHVNADFAALRFASQGKTPSICSTRYLST